MLGAGVASAQVTPIGPEFRVNVETTDDQQDPRVAVDDFGNCVVVWESFRQDGSNEGVYMRIFGSDGVPVTGDVLVPSYTQGRQEDPAVAVSPDGKIIVVWEGQGDDGDQFEFNGIWGRRFDMSGNALDATQIRCNTTSSGIQRNPDVSIADDGKFVVGWDGEGNDGQIVGVYFQRFLADGSKAGTETPGNATTAGAQGNAAVKLRNNGDVVVTWNGNGPGDSNGVFFQRFDNTDTAVGPETLVNEASLVSERNPSIGCDGDGNFVIAWDEGTGPGFVRGVFKRRYNADGTPRGSSQLVNTFVDGEQDDANISVRVDAAGNYVIVWESDEQDGDDNGVYAQRYAANGFPMGDEFPVNTETDDHQDDPDVAIDSAGNFIVVWESSRQDGSKDGVYAQRFQSRIRLVGTCQCFWDNGEWDGDGQASVIGGVIIDGGAQVADDFYLPNGKYYRLDSVNALMLTNDDTPEAVLEIYSDCNGKPDRLIESFELSSWQDTGLSGRDETALIEMQFDTSEGCWLEGGQMYWVSVYGVGRDGWEVYYFATAGEDTVQGVEAQFLLPKEGYVDWTPIKETNVGKSDVAFSVCVTECDIVADNGEFDPTYDLPVEINQARVNYRAADNFSLPPCTTWHVDMVQVCVLTNCDLATLKLDIYETDPVTCMPYLTPIASYSGADKAIPLGISLNSVEVVPMTVDAFLVQFQNLELDLPGGQTYWVGVGAEGTGSLRDRSFVCFSFDCNKDSSCQVKISPAKFLKPSTGAWESFNSFLNEEKDRELVFTVCARPERGWFRDGDPMRDIGRAIAGAPDEDVMESKDEITADVNGDGVINDTDFFAFTQAFFGATGVTNEQLRPEVPQQEPTGRRPVSRATSKGSGEDPEVGR